MTIEVDEGIDLLLEKALDEENLTTNSLILWNDEHTPIDLVVETIVDVLGFPSQQAEQLTMIAHYKGRANMKNGSYDELKEIKDKFESRDIVTTIE